MSWTKLGDEYPAETADLSDAGFRLHALALCWSNWRLLDLVIPARDLRKFAFIESRPVDVAIEELIAAGWWQRTDEGDYWIGCRFSEWQRDRVQVEHLRERNGRNQRRKRRHELDDHSLCLPDRCKALSPGDTSGDSFGDSLDECRDDPGRVGSGRDGRTQTRLEEKKREVDSSEPHATSPSATCVECGSPDQLLAGEDDRRFRCRAHHRFGRRAS